MYQNTGWDSTLAAHWFMKQEDTKNEEKWESDGEGKTVSS